MSGIDLEDGTKIRKGSGEAIINYVKKLNGLIPSDLNIIKNADTNKIYLYSILIKNLKNPKNYKGDYFNEPARNIFP